MTRNQEPTNDDDLERAKKEIAAAFDEVRDDLDEDADNEEAVVDGGEWTRRSQPVQRPLR